LVNIEIDYLVIKDEKFGVNQICNFGEKEILEFPHFVFQAVNQPKTVITGEFDVSCTIMGNFSQTNFNIKVVTFCYLLFDKSLV
jgi:predicted ester cyclase